MPPSLVELLNALPADEDADDRKGSRGKDFIQLLEGLQHKSVPQSALRRLCHLGGLQTQIGFAYAAYWVRGWFQGQEERQEQLLETHLRAAVKLLRSMAYLRGAVMKIGQTLANFPDAVPDEFVETLEQLHFEAPPMHYELVRAYLRDELGADPHEVFAEFEEEAFAAASLGQVHRARLKSGEEVAVKVQYPGIARTVRSDFRNLLLLLQPLRLNSDWENVKDQIEELRNSIDRETDYVREAETLRRSRALFSGHDEVWIPRVYPEHSTARVLTMEYIPGKTTSEFLAGNPPQALRDHFGSAIFRMGARFYYQERLYYGDPHPGNYLFLDDGRLGWIDFGNVREFTDSEWHYLQRGNAAFYGDREEKIDFLAEGMLTSRKDLVADTDTLEPALEMVEWMGRPWNADGPFDFGDGDYLREGFRLIDRRGARGGQTVALSPLPVPVPAGRGGVEHSGAIGSFPVVPKR